MDLITGAAAGGSVGAVYAVIRIAERYGPSLIAWLLRRPSKNGKGVSEDKVRVMIYEHKEKCTAGIRDELKEFKKELTKEIADILLNGNGR